MAKKGKNNHIKRLIASNLSREVIKHGYKNIVEFGRANNIGRTTLYRIMRQKEGYGVDVLINIADKLDIKVQDLFRE